MHIHSFDSVKLIIFTNALMTNYDWGSDWVSVVHGVGQEISAFLDHIRKEGWFDAAACLSLL
jgi:hypothetical protein